MKHYFYLLLALCIGAVVMSCRPSNEPEKPDRPHIGDTELNIDSPVGTVGTLDGHEAMVVDLGGSIGKVAIATMNVGATSVKDGAGSETTATCYGDYISYDDAMTMSKNHSWGKGWYLPSNDELEALLSHLNKADGYDYYQWAVTNTSILYFPLSGYISPDDAEPIHMGNTAFYSSCTEGEIAEWSRVIHMDQRGAEMWDYYKAGKISVRLFHKLPPNLPNITNDSPVGTIGLLDDREGIVVDLGGDIGKIVIATMNVGATSVIDGAGSETTATCYGDYLSFEDAISMSNYELWGIGWYLPSNDELEALLSHLNKADGYDYYQWAVTNTSILYFPLSGYISPGDVDPHHLGNTAFYSSCTQGEIDEWSKVIHMDLKGAEMWDYEKAGKISVRPFHKMPPLPAPVDAVDLGLSVKWASMNVGAAKPEDYGFYFAWGETMEKSNYDWFNEGDYKWGIFDFNASPLYGMTKYTADLDGGDNLNTLQPGDDPATANWGGKWRTPTIYEVQELLDTTKCEWTWDDTKKGYTIKGIRTGQSIFLPAAGVHGGSDFSKAGEEGFYWSSSLSYNWVHYASIYFFGSGYYDWFDNERYFGLPVRAVQSAE